MCLISIKHFIVSAILCVTVFNLYNNNYLFVILLYTSVLVNTNNCSVNLCNGNLKTTTATTFLHTPLHTRLTEILLLIVCLLALEESLEKSFKTSLLFVYCVQC